MNNIYGNLVAGITSAVIALPLALAFGVASGMGAVAGIYGAIILGFFAALFGGTKTQISGPTGPMTVVFASVVAMYSDPAIVFTIVFLAGIIQILLGISKIGRFVHYIPYPVTSGFMSGIGVIIILLQLNPLVGNEFAGSTLEIVKNLPNTFSNIDSLSLLLSALTLLILFFTPQKISKIIPSSLIALLAVTTFSIVMGFNIATIGEIPSAMPSFYIPTFSSDEIRMIIQFSLTLAILGSIDSLLTSLVADSLTKTEHNPNKELIGQGIGNSVCGIFGAIPGAGATMRTVVNIKSGGTDRLSGAVHSLGLLAFIVGGSFLVEKIPLAVLAGILVKVGIDILDYRFFKKIAKAPKHDLYVMLTVFFLTIFVDLITAVGVGIVLAALLLINRLNEKMKIEVEAIIDEKENCTVEEDTEGQIRIIHIDGPFFFGSTYQIINHTKHFLDTEVLVLDCSRVPFMDISAVFSLEEIFDDLIERDIAVIVILKGEIAKKRFNNLGLTDILGEENVLLNYKMGIRKAKSILKEKHPEKQSMDSSIFGY